MPCDQIGASAALKPTDLRSPDPPIRRHSAVGALQRTSHTSVDARDAYAQPVFWSQVLDFTEDPDDPDEPGHGECLIVSRDRSQLLLFITVPDGKTVKNRVHLDLRPVDRTRKQETGRLLAPGASQQAWRRVRIFVVRRRLAGLRP
jgi:hypothetical protein